MSRVSVSQIMRTIDAIKSNLDKARQIKKREFQTIKGVRDARYGEVQSGIYEYIKGADEARLALISDASKKVGLMTDFNEIVADARRRNTEIAQTLKGFAFPFGDIALPPDSGVKAVAPDGLTAEEIKARLNAHIDRHTNTKPLLKLAKALIDRGHSKNVTDNGMSKKLVTLDQAESFLDSCRNLSFIDFFRPSVWAGRSLNRMKDKGEFDAIAEIKTILDYRYTLEALCYVEGLKSEYTEEHELNIKLRDKVMGVFGSEKKFEALAPVLGSATFIPLAEMFAEAAAAQGGMDRLKPVISHFDAQIREADTDLSVLRRVRNLSGSQSFEFNKRAYEQAIVDADSDYTPVFKRVLNQLEEEERARKAAEAARRAAEESRRQSSYSSIGSGGFGGGGGFSGGGGSFGGGGASGSW